MNNPVWIDEKGKIIEPEYCRDFLSRHPMRCINDHFYTVEGPLPDESKLKRMKSNLRNEIKSYIVRSGYTMQEVVDRLSEDYGWSDSVSNLSNKLQRESLRYVEAVQLADALGYDLVWQKRRDK